MYRSGSVLRLNFEGALSTLRVSDIKGKYIGLAPNLFVFSLCDQSRDQGIFIGGHWSSIYHNLCENFEFIEFNNLPRNCVFKPEASDAAAFVVNLKAADRDSVV